MTRNPSAGCLVRNLRRIVLIGVVLAAAGACAPKRPTLPGPALSPKFPEFVYPSPPARLGPPTAAAAHEAAWQWLQAGDLRTAEKSFTAVLKEAPEFYPSEAGLGYVALAKKDFRTATSHFDRALVVDGTYAPALAGRGDALLTLGQRDQALASFEAAVAADPKLTELSSRIGVLRFRGMQDDVDAARKAADAGKLAEARTIYERSLAASPESPFLYRELAVIERRSGSLDAALGHAQKAAELSPNEWRNFVTLGEIHEAKGDYARAAEAYGTAAALEPGAGLDARISELREKAAFASMPDEYPIDRDI